MLLRNQKYLAEIKATLLPIISALSRPAMLPDEHHPEVTPNLLFKMIYHPHATKQTQLARFDDNFKLTLNHENWERLRSDETTKICLSNVISVLGDTHVGKSTLVTALIREARASAREDNRHGRIKKEEV